MLYLKRNTFRTLFGALEHQIHHLTCIDLYIVAESKYVKIKVEPAICRYKV